MCVFCASLAVLTRITPYYTKDTGSSRMTGPRWIETSLAAMKNRLNPVKPISAQLLPIVDSAISIANGITTISESSRAVDGQLLDVYKPQIADLVAAMQELVIIIDLILQQPGSIAAGPATPPTPIQPSSDTVVRPL